MIDTNVIVSALLKAGSVPDRMLSAAWERGAVVLYDARILVEYRDVVTRPKFRAIDRARIDVLFAMLAAHGQLLGAVPPWSGTMTDDDDRVFVEVALAGKADVLVTGNLRDFPIDLGFDVEPPAMVLARLG
ncbi:hypothetical protein AKJ09_10794 [Labilithrix luteola]|uniref:PIN domain-containing protein n=1 Tax=Labilithrix luteola TaxID=1391654 RepID=A0A0K1QED7_9BACT|nr:hypothetical protein AKJ09_10794 [Labilithrix luteola]